MLQIETSIQQYSTKIKIYQQTLCWSGHKVSLATDCENLNEAGSESLPLARWKPTIVNM